MEPPADAGRERPLLEARNISKFFGAITALDHVNFQLAKVRWSAWSGTMAPANRR